jgi:YfiH family protein
MSEPAGQWAPIIPEWPAPAWVRAIVTTRTGGYSQGAYASLNLGVHCGDDPRVVERNRTLVAARLGARPVWMRQVHGTGVLDAGAWDVNHDGEPEADAAWASRAGVACAVMIADCLPLLVVDEARRAVAAIHAGWRGLAAGVIERGLEAMGEGPKRVWLGPAIGPEAYEIGAEVRARILEQDSGAEAVFRPSRPGHWYLDLYEAARRRLRARGIGDDRIHGGGHCTLRDPAHCFSYRREGPTGRMAALIWMD